MLEKEIKRLKKRIRELEDKLNSQTKSISDLESDNQRYKRYIDGHTVYSPHGDISLEINCEDYVKNFKEDGARRHAFMAGAKSIIEKIR